MTRRRPPYQLVADVGSVILVVFILVAYRFLPGAVPNWAFALAWVVAAAVLVGVLTELYLFYREYRAGVLFPMRNASLFILLLSVVGLPLYVAYNFATGQYLGPSTLLLIPVLLAFATRNLFRVHLDTVTLRAKTGFRSPVEVPLFQLGGGGRQRRPYCHHLRPGPPHRTTPCLLLPATLAGPGAEIGGSSPVDLRPARLR